MLGVDLSLKGAKETVAARRHQALTVRIDHRHYVIGLASQSLQLMRTALCCCELSQHMYMLTHVVAQLCVLRSARDGFADALVYDTLCNLRRGFAFHMTPNHAAKHQECRSKHMQLGYVHVVTLRSAKLQYSIAI